MLSEIIIIFPFLDNAIFQPSKIKLVLVKKSGVNGNVRGLGNKRKLDLNIFIQMTVNSFAEKEGRTPRDWCDIVDAIFLHCNGDHSKCSLLERYRGVKYFTICKVFMVPIFDLKKMRR